MHKVIVEQAETPKTSSSRRTPSPNVYMMKALVACLPRIPKSTQLTGEFVTAKFGVHEVLEAKRWRVPPHVRLANLPTYDKQGKMSLRTDLPTHEEHGEPMFGPEPELRADGRAVESFVRTYGLLVSVRKAEEALMTWEQNAGYLPYLQESEGPTAAVFREDIAAITAAQGVLRRAWADDHYSLDLINEYAARTFALNALHPNGIVFETTYLWNFICLLFMHDYRVGKNAMCANPDCPAPYFLKRRKTQKICEAGECVKWAQRGYALRWWRENRGLRQGPNRRRKR